MQQHRKAIAAGGGVLLIALLEYATTAPDVARALETVAPSPWGQLAPVLLGGAATVLAVWRATNAQQSAPADTVPEPAPEPAPVPAPTAASPPDGSPPTVGAGAPIMAPPPPAAPFRDRVAAPATSLVQLVPPPAPDYQ